MGRGGSGGAADEDEVACIVTGVADEVVLGGLVGVAGNNDADVVGEELGGGEAVEVHLIEAPEEGGGEDGVAAGAACIGNGLVATAGEQVAGFGRGDLLKEARALRSEE